MSDVKFYDRAIMLPGIIAGFTLVTAVLFAVTYPTHFLIADEVAYFEQGLEWAGESPSVVSDYPPGTALLAAGLVRLLGAKAVFWSGIGAFFIGIWALAALLYRLKKPAVWALYPALFLPGLVLTRTLMSDLPGFALACIFLLLYVGSPHSRFAGFFAGLAAGFGVLFRETNVLWALPFLVGAVWRGRVGPTPSPSPRGEGGLPSNNLNYPVFGIKASLIEKFQVNLNVAPLPLGGVPVPHFSREAGGGVDATCRPDPKVLWLGFAVGLILRLAWGWISFGDPFFIRDSGIGFSVDFLPQNLLFYLIALLVLAPGGLYFLVKNKSPYRLEILAVVLLFLGVYGSYGYDAFAKSGWKGLVLQGRYLLPLLPLLALVAAETLPVVGRGFIYGIAVVAVALFAGVQFSGHAYNLEQQRITDALLRLPTQAHLTFTPDESRKYLNALHGPHPLQIPTQNPKLNTQNCYAHLITRSDSADRIKKTAEAEAAFQRYFRGAKTTPVTDLTIRDGTRLRIWRVRQTNCDEQTR